MGKKTDFNRISLEEAVNYEDAVLKDLFDPKEFCLKLDTLVNAWISSGKTITSILDSLKTSRSYFNDLRNPSKDTRPTRNTVLDIALAMNLTKEDTNELLRLAGYNQLDPRGGEIDTILIWGLEKKSPLEIREKLIEKGFSDFDLL